MTPTLVAVVLETFYDLPHALQMIRAVTKKKGQFLLHINCTNIIKGNNVYYSH